MRQYCFGVAIILEHMYLYILHHTYFYKFYENFDEGTILFSYKNAVKISITTFEKTFTPFL